MVSEGSLENRLSGCRGVHKQAEAGSQLIPDAAKGFQSFLVCSRYGAWIRNAPVDSAGRTQKTGTDLGSTVANGDDRGEMLPLKLTHGLGSLPGDIDADFAHYFYGQGAYSDRAGPRALDLVLTLAEVTQKAFRNLAPDRITGAEDKNAVFFLSFGHFPGADRPQAGAQQLGAQHAAF